MDISVIGRSNYSELEIKEGAVLLQVTVYRNEYSSVADSLREAANELSDDPKDDRIKELEQEVENLQYELKEMGERDA